MKIITVIEQASEPIERVLESLPNNNIITISGWLAEPTWCENAFMCKG